MERERFRHINTLIQADTHRECQSAGVEDGKVTKGRRLEGTLDINKIHEVLENNKMIMLSDSEGPEATDESVFNLIVQ